MLGLGNSVSASQYPGGEWSPLDESSCELWAQKNVGLTLNESAISGWNDQSGNDNHLVQANNAHQPSGHTDGAVRLDGGTSNQHFDLTSQITLGGAFVVGMRLFPAGTPSNECLFGDTTTTNHFVRMSSASVLHFKNSSTLKGLSLNGGTTFGDGYLLINRDASDVITLYIDGVLQTAAITAYSSGDVLIDAIGARGSTVNEFGGTMSEVLMFSASSADLISNVNTYLSTIA